MSQRRRFGLVLAFGLALALRVAWWWYARPEPVSDFEVYRQLGAGILDHGAVGYPEPSAQRVPGYPSFLAAAMLVSRSVAWLSLANVVLSALLAPLAGALASALGWPRRVAVIAAVTVAVDPTFVFFAPVLASEHLYALLLLSALLLAVGGRPEPVPGAPRTDRRRAALPPAGRYLAAGAVFGVAVLTRPDALFSAPVLVAAAWASGGVRRHVAAGAAVLAATLVVAPWLARNRVVVGPGAGLSTIGGVDFYFAHNDRRYGWHSLAGTPLEGLTEVEASRRGWALGHDHLRHVGLRAVVRDVRTGTARLYLPGGFPFAVYWSTRSAPTDLEPEGRRERAGLTAFESGSRWYLVVVCGALLSVLLARTVPARAALVLYGVIATNWVGYCVIFFADARFRYATEVACCLLTAHAAVWLVERLRAGAARR